MQANHQTVYHTQKLLPLINCFIYFANQNAISRCKQIIRLCTILKNYYLWSTVLGGELSNRPKRLSINKFWAVWAQNFICRKGDSNFKVKCLLFLGWHTVYVRRGLALPLNMSYIFLTTAAHHTIHPSYPFTPHYKMRQCAVLLHSLMSHDSCGNTTWSMQQHHTHVTWFMQQHHIAATPHSCHMIHAATPHDSCSNTTWSMQQHHMIHAATPHDPCSNTTPQQWGVLRCWQLNAPSLKYPGYPIGRYPIVDII